MTHLLNCPVCGYKEIASNTCPNCDTDISLLRSLAELPVSVPSAAATSLSIDTGDIVSISSLRFSRTGWQVGVALLILVLGIALGGSGSFFFLQRSQLLTTTPSPPNSVTTQDETKPPIEITQDPNAPKQPTQYTVKPGDNLTVITEKSCGKNKPWQLMVKANPQLKSRPNYIKVGEVLNPPNCEG
jgi:hypothetical protein